MDCPRDSFCGRLDCFWADAVVEKFLKLLDGLIDGVVSEVSAVV